MDNLTTEQHATLEYALSQYRWWCADKKDEGLDNAFKALAEHIDEVSCMEYRILFANVVEDMQKENWNLSQDCIDTKMQIYFDAAKYYFQHRDDTESYAWALP